ncbi:DUF4352 domain-containing protein [Timonella senegalensis]|uniref:DUF4352 domain-containing protein n=2 Tax=Timonella senegalensis TaxID=1465825 RepID=UPI0006857D2F|nr:DUF4352 domain-containing protein [Timonella senegalensis]
METPNRFNPLQPFAQQSGPVQGQPNSDQGQPIMQNQQPNQANGQDPMNSRNSQQPPTQQFPQQPAQPQQPGASFDPMQGHYPAQGQPFPAMTPPEPKKNWFSRHKFLTAIGAVAVIGIAASAFGGGSSDTPTPQASPSSSATQEVDNSKDKDAKEDKPEEKPEEAPAADFKIGDVAEVGDMTYKVTSVKTSKTVGSQYLEEKAKGTYVVVEVDVTNNSNESALISTSFFKLRSGDKTFEADDMASITANSSDDLDSFFLEELNPDLTASGIVVFDVSEKVAKAKDNVLVAQTGFWGTQTVDILLAK